MTVKAIEFEVEGARLRGHLHLPRESGPRPAVVVGGPMTSVKEQVTGVYAEALARRGVVALSIDPRHFGESEGEPRQYENYHDKIADYRAALDALSEQTEVDPGRLGAVGVCLGVGYIFHAAAHHPQVKALAGVAGYYRDVPALRSRDPEGFEAKVEQGREARLHYERTGETLSIPAVARDGDAAMTLASTYDYYGTPRAGVANYTNAFAVMSREHFLTFDVQSVAPRVSAPVLMVHGENALNPDWARKFYAALTVEKTLRWLDGANQTDFYDRPHLVEPAAELISEHLERYL